MSILTTGDKAPAFQAKDQNGNTVNLADYAGKTVILYFYPRDLTPGCTTQACALRDEYPAIQAKNAVVLGVSPDDEASHRKFISTHELPFTLLADPEHKLAETYGVWVEKSMYGKKYMGIERSTFIIGPDGRIENVLRMVKPKEHAKDLLTLLS